MVTWAPGTVAFDAFKDDAAHIAAGLLLSGAHVPPPKLTDKSRLRADHHVALVKVILLSISPILGWNYV